MTPSPTLPRLSDYVRHWSNHHPDRDAAVLDDTRITYADLSQRVTAFSRALLAAGVTHGDRVAMLTPPRPDFLIAMLSTSDIGAIWLGLHPRYRLPELHHVVDEAQPRILIAYPEIDGRAYASDLAALAANHTCIEETVLIGDTTPNARSLDDFIATGETIDDVTLDAARRAVQPRDTAVIIFTSGTTGAPKGAMISHLALVRGARAQSAHWPSDHMRLLQSMPPNHIACLGMSTAQALFTGGTVVFVDRFEPSRVLDAIERERITFFMHAPAIYHMLLNEPGFADRDLSSLEYWLWAGAPAPVDLVERLHAFGGHVGTAFGMTELGAYVTYTDPDASLEALAGSIGRPAPNCDLRLANAEGHRAPPGEQGEIQARGEWLLNGYVHQPDATRDAYTSDGWFRTGDIAVEREDGNWTLVGRLKEMFKSGGYNVYPREIEIAIEAHPAVAMAAILGIPDPRWHEVGHAFVQPAPGTEIDPSTIDAWCREHLANYKVPKKFEVTPELPRLPIGKIDKQALKRILEGRAEGSPPPD